MPAWSFALRLLLCLVVALNGASPVVAVMHAHATQLASASTHPAGHRACHETAPMSATAPRGETHVDTGHAGDHDMDGGCCGTLDCACACIHHAPAAAPAMLAGAQDRPRMDVPGGTRPGHAPPPSSVQIRPPIG